MKMNLLEKIDAPEDLKRLYPHQLPQLAAEIRRTIVKVVSQTGGHLASSLGVVELTIAMHYVFNSPQDKFIFDVGHQAYTHKLLTGRRRQFATQRQIGGLSGFTRMSESPHDAFTTGHSSTSISAGLGMTCANHLDGKTSKVISLIGDGSMTAGLAFEGLNQTGGMHANQIVILNDNEMSISPNVGALSSFLSRTFSAKRVQELRTDLKVFLKSLPGIGDDVYQFVKHSEDSFKSFITPGMLFEAFDFKYLGPIDGHRLDHLIDILKNIKEVSGPVLLHVITTKGRGYPPAEKNPVFFHGVGSFEPATGKSAKKHSSPAYTKIFGTALVKLAQEDKKIVAVTAAMPEGTGLKGFATTYPDRFFDVGIAEQHGVTFAAGLASQGYKPVVAIYSTFLQRAYDQILHDVCLENLHVVFALDRAGVVGEDGPTHHGLFDLAFLRNLPNMVIMAPKDERELPRMLKTALEYNGPAAIRYPRGTGPGVMPDVNITALPLGKAEILEKGDDILILALGSMVTEALIAHHELKKHGIETTVVNTRFVKPLDIDLIVGLAVQIPKIITIEEHLLQAGFGSAVLEALNDQGLYNPVIRLGIKDLFVEHGPQKELRTKYGVDAAAIVNAAIRIKNNVHS